MNILTLVINILSETKKIHSAHEVFQSIGQKKPENLDTFIFIQFKYNVSSIISPIPKIFVIKVVILQLESVRYQQRQNPLAYMMCIYSILNLQCIIAGLSNMLFMSRERLSCYVLAHISHDKSKRGPE